VTQEPSTIPRELETFLEDPSKHEKEIVDFLTSKKADDTFPYFFQIAGLNKSSKVDKILSSLESHPKILSQILLKQFCIDNLKNFYSPLSVAIILGFEETVEKILSSLKKYPDILERVLTEDENPAIHQAIYCGETKILEKILTSLQNHQDIFQKVLTHKNTLGRSPPQIAIVLGKLESVKTISSITDSKILKSILSDYIPYQDKVLFLAIGSVFATKSSESEEILKLLVKKAFNTDLNPSQILALTNFFKNHALLALMSRQNYGIGFNDTPNTVARIVKEVVASGNDKLKDNPISKIYTDEIDKANSENPISIDNNKELYIYNSNVSQHKSYLIFKVDPQTKKLISISYCDGNYIAKLKDQKLDNGKVYGVREYEIENDITYSSEFAKNFIQQNFENKDLPNEVQLPFKVDSEELTIKKTTPSIETKHQLRGNCGFKSDNILARYLYKEKTGNDYSKDYREFKTQLRLQVVNGLAKDYETIKAQFSEEFVKFLGIEKSLEDAHHSKFSTKEQMKDVLFKAIKKTRDADNTFYPDPTMPLVTSNFPQAPTQQPIMPLTNFRNNTNSFYFPKKQNYPPVPPKQIPKIVPATLSNPNNLLTNQANQIPARILDLGIGIGVGMGVAFCASALGLGAVSSAPVLATAIGAGAVVGGLTFIVSNALVTQAKKTTNKPTNTYLNS